MTTIELHEFALRAIGNACLTDFRDGLTWAQWCRTMAQAACEDDEDGVRALITHIPED